MPERAANLVILAVFLGKTASVALIRMRSSFEE
jgi:hypothetical protein